MQAPDPDAPVSERPLGLSPVSAGFPSPAEDYEQATLDINRYLVRNPVSTFFFRVKGESMTGAQLYADDILVVDRSVTPAHGHIVVAFVNGERLVKRLHMKNGRSALLAENPNFAPIELTEELEVTIWGVVVGSFRRIQF